MNPAQLQKQHPSSDPIISYRYSSSSVSEKKKNKISFYKDKKNNPFVVLFFTDDLNASEQKIFHTLVEGLSVLPNVQILIMGEKQKLPGSCSFLERKKLSCAFAIADVVFLFPSQNKSLFSEMMMGMKYGTAPIVYSNEKTKNIIFPFDPVQEKGNGFLYEKENKWSMFEAIIRAKENFRFPYDWENIIRACMEE